MVNDYKSFGCFRYFMVPYEQVSVFQMQAGNRKTLIENIIDNTETALKIEDSNYEEKYKLYLVNKLDSDNYLLKLGRHAQITRSEDTGDDFEESKLDDHPYIHIFINTKEQILLLEKKTKVFRTYVSSANALSNYFAKRVDKYGYEFKYEEITLPEKFWNLVDSATSINSVSLTLYSPNLFDGNTSAEMAAKEFEEVTNSTENTLTFRNKHGKLKLIKNKLKSFIDYISGGGGNWHINASIPNKRKTEFSSKQTTKVVHMPFDITERNEEALLDSIVPIISSINHKPGDDDLNGDNKKDKGDK